MDAHTLGAWLGAWREGISSSTMPIYPTRGQWLPYRGRDMEKTSFPPLSAHSSGDCGFKPCDKQKLIGHKIQLLAWRDYTHDQADFPVSLPSNTTYSLLPRSFLPALPSSSWIFKQVVDTYIVTYRLYYLFVLSFTHKPRLDNFPVWACSVGIKNSNNLYLQLLCKLCPHCTLIF